MLVSKLSDYTGGWIIGNFNPSLLKTKDFELCVKHHKKGELWPTHYHKLGNEYNVLVSGKMTINGIELMAGDVFVIPVGEVSSPIFLEDCVVVVLKTPSVPGDKYEI